MSKKSSVSLVVLPFLLVGMGFLVLGFYWSNEPAPFNVIDEAINEAQQIDHPVVVGTATTAALIHEVNVLLEKRGGYLSNDMVPPGIFMDNIPSWEYGVLLQVRDLVRAMHDNIGRLPPSQAEDEDLAIAESRLNISHNSWLMPDTQAEYQVGVDHLRDYLERLSDTENPRAHFSARADNLAYWLLIVEGRLGNLSQRLSASVGQRQLVAGVVADAMQQPPAVGDALLTRTPWNELDDVFYEARGSSWALMHLLQAVEIDYSDLLRQQNAQLGIAQVLRELEATQVPLSSPIILNGSGFGLWANHSLVMASYISRACTGVTALREKMEKVAVSSHAAQEGKRHFSGPVSLPAKLP